MPNEFPGATPRGRLKIYLGAAPGVGKTYDMLTEAHQLIEAGTDVVAAVIEDHGRAATRKLAAGIEQVPQKKIRLNADMTVSELDVQAVIARRPQVCLVDEYAHTVASEGKINDDDRRRWQDVEEILAAGIDVISTLNIQHVESLNDVVENITGIVQRETVPDAVVRRANDIELVDLGPEMLRARLARGEVYGPDRLDEALSNYFRVGNLTALRELALLWLADQVDDALATYRESTNISDTWEARERLIVAISGGPESETLIRRGARIASKSSADVMVVHVIRGDGMVGTSSERLRSLRELVADVGATMHQVTGDDVPTALLHFAKASNATQIVVGTSRKPARFGLTATSTATSVAQNSGRIDIHLVSTPQDDTFIGSALRRLTISNRSQLQGRLIQGAIALAVPWMTTGILTQLPGLGFAGYSAVYFASILLVSLIAGLVGAVISAVLGALLLNWFFTEPVRTLTIEHPDHLLSLFVMILLAVAVSVLVDRSKKQALRARDAAREAEILALFSRSVLKDGTLPGLLNKLITVYGQSSARAIDNATGEIIATAESESHSALSGSQSAAANPGKTGATPAGKTNSANPAETGASDNPPTATTTVRSDDEKLTLELVGPPIDSQDRDILVVVASQAAGIMRQDSLSRQAARTEAVEAADDLRRSLLSAVSHDLRTPLAAATLSVSSLLHSGLGFSDEDREDLLLTTEESLNQLTRLVSNLLDNSRLAAGVISPQIQSVHVEEVVARAVADCSSTWGSNVPKVNFVIDGGSTLRSAQVKADPGLLERVLANLVENAFRYGLGQPIEVMALESEGKTQILVIDHGSGVDESAAETMFVPFQRLGDTSRANGVGLGLSVVRGFTEAMEGTVSVHPTPGGGSTFIVTLDSA